MTGTQLGRAHFVHLVARRGNESRPQSLDPQISFKKFRQARVAKIDTPRLPWKEGYGT